MEDKTVRHEAVQVTVDEMLTLEEQEVLIDSLPQGADDADIQRVLDFGKEAKYNYLRFCLIQEGKARTEIAQSGDVCVISRNYERLEQNFRDIFPDFSDED